MGFKQMVVFMIFCIGTKKQHQKKVITETKTKDQTTLLAKRIAASSAIMNEKNNTSFKIRDIS